VYRRRLLASVPAAAFGVGTVGCLGRSGSEEDDRSTDTTPRFEVTVGDVREYTTADELPLRNVGEGVAEYEQRHGERPTFRGLSDYGVEPTVTVVRPTVTADHTARLRVELHNRSDDPATFRTLNGRLLGAPQSVGDGRLVLATPDADVERADDCWRSARGFAFELGRGTVRIPPGERVSTDRDVWGNDRCPAPGSYLFLQRYDDPDLNEGELTDVYWSFGVALEGR
jgi:hypothetical protein